MISGLAKVANHVSGFNYHLLISDTYCTQLVFKFIGEAHFRWYNSVITSLCKFITILNPV